MSNLSYYEASDKTLYVCSSTAVIERSSDFDVYDIRLKGKPPEEGDRIYIVNVGAGNISYRPDNSVTISGRNGSPDQLGQAGGSHTSFIYADIGGGNTKWIMAMDYGN